MKRLPYVFTIVVTSLAAFGVQWKYQQDIASLKQAYRDEETQASQKVADVVQNTFDRIYQGLRTMARLPGVRAIDRYGKTFEGDARQTVQELYNSLGTSVAMSEVYIVPEDINPDQIDPNTKAPGAPIVTFDELVVGKRAESEEEAEEGAAANQVEEIEIYEYRLMREQIAWLKQHYPEESKVEGLNYPAVGGPEVITCDNSRYSTAHPNDKDRSGLVYSVPFFSPHGAFKGLLSGVILTHALSDLLPTGAYAVVNRKTSQVIKSHSAGPSADHLQDIQQGLAANNLIYSSTLTLPIKDTNGEWILWSGAPDQKFWERADVAAAVKFRWATLMLLLMGALAASLWIWRRSKQRTAIESIIISLGSTAEAVEHGVVDIGGVSSELLKSASTQSAAVQESVASMAEMSSMIAQTSESSSRSLKVTQTVSEQSQEGVRIMEELTAAMGAIEQANQSLVEMTRIIDEISTRANVINDIVFKTQLLAFNASIEAARAGQHGRGFAVVAEEVGALAEMSGSAAKEIQRLLESSRQQVSSIVDNTAHRVSNGQDVMRRALESFGKITHAIHDIDEQMKSIAGATREQQIGVQQTNSAMGELGGAAQRNNSLSMATSNYVADLSKQTKALRAIMQQLHALVFGGQEAKQTDAAQFGSGPRKSLEARESLH
ncbi:MAG: hypothetical protein K1X79_07295 [Oligoflexia bacterium]|nr:hypothetical protein [Oligoflexia bacterium]